MDIAYSPRGVKLQIRPISGPPNARGRGTPLTGAAVAAIVGTPHALAGEPEPGRVVRADQDGRVPVEALAFFPRLRLRLDVDLLAGAAVVTHQVVAATGIDDVVGQVHRG
jgi:hypothetical protein